MAPDTTTGRERRPRRDRGGATGTVAASPGFRVRDGSVRLKVASDIDLRRHMTNPAIPVAVA
ncbi:hypothetical protein GJ368_18325 [Shigella boydii]|nr:hypothetical protein [Shigella boydii]EFV7691492.1 hypothetical protein [Shigella boydii]EFX6081984.1 hypothetical protein [Shigella boydii]RIF84659.1 hypothetical protein UQ76_11765 [Shigella boydii]